MSILTEAANNMLFAEKHFDISVNRANAYADMAVMEAAIRLDEAELQVMQESANDADYDADGNREYLFEQAQEGFVGKITAAIKSIIEAVREFFRKLKDKIVSLFTKKEVGASIDKLESKVKLNPFLRNKKAEIVDDAKEKNVIMRYIEKLKKMMARLKAGDDVSEDEIEEAKESFFKEHAAAIAATTAVTVAALFAIIRSKLKSTGKDASEAEKEAESILKKAQDAVSDMIDAAKASKLQKLASAIAGAFRTLGSSIVSAPSKAIRALKEKVGKGASSDDDDLATESATASSFFNRNSKGSDDDESYTTESSEDEKSPFDDFEDLLGE